MRGPAVLHLRAANKPQTLAAWPPSPRADHLRAAQNETTGGWPSSGTEYAIVNGEAVQALVACVTPVHNAATTYADGPVAGNLPFGLD